MIARQVFTIALALIVAVLLQANLSAVMAIRLARPDFITVTVICLALLTGFGRGTAGGLWGGFLFAALCGANFGSFMVSRGIAGGLIGKIPKSLQRDNAYLPVIAVLLGTIVTEVVYFIMAPASPVGWWFKVMLSEALYNAVIALPIYWLLQRAMPRQRTSFAPYRR